MSINLPALCNAKVSTNGSRTRSNVRHMIRRCGDIGRIRTVATANMHAANKYVWYRRLSGLLIQEGSNVVALRHFIQIPNGGAHLQIGEEGLDAYAIRAGCCGKNHDFITWNCFTRGIGRRGCVPSSRRTCTKRSFQMTGRGRKTGKCCCEGEIHFE